MTLCALIIVMDMVNAWIIHATATLASMTTAGQHMLPVAQTGEIKAILSVGHFNITSRKALKAMLKEEKDMSALIVGFTSINCHRCIAVEYHYDQFLKDLDLSGGGLEVETSQTRKGQASKKVCIW